MRLGPQGRWLPLAVVLAVFLAGLVAPVMVVSPATPRAEAADEPPVEATAEAAQAEARRSGREVEVAAWRGESREVFAQADGTFTAKEHVRPVRARRAGKWASIDTALRFTADGAVAPGVTAVDVRFSGGGSGPMVRIAGAGRSLEISWPGPGELPEPRIDGDTAIYADVLPGVDLWLQAESDGMRQLLVVKTAAAAASAELAKLSFSLGGDGLRVEQESSGVLLAKDSVSGATAFTAPQPIMWDSSTTGSGEAAPGEDGGGTEVPAPDPAVGPGDGAKVADVATSVSGSTLTLTPDQELLTGTDTTFPVMIDPAWRTEKASAWAMVSSGYPSESYYKFDGKSTEGVGFCDVSLDSSCVKDQTKRLFYRVPTSFFAGKQILSAEFTAYETAAYNCDSNTVVQLWRASSFGTSSTWNSTSDNWKEHLDSRDVSYCSSTPVEFNATAAVKDAAAGGWSTTTFGLRAYSESSMSWWKRFADDAYLRVNYNRVPGQVKMSQLTMSPGGACVDWTDPPFTNDLPRQTMLAKDVTDPDGDNVYVQFQVKWNDTVQWTKTVGPKSSGSDFTLDYDGAGGPTPPQNTQLHWYVRAGDGTAWGPWSWAGSATGCYFYYDSTHPTGPAITSTDGRYPESNPEDPNDGWHDGVGRYGAFRLDSSATDVTSYQYTVNGKNAKTVTTSGGAAVSVQIAPTTSGLNYVSAQAFDAAGNNSTKEVYYFRVSAGSDPTAHWKLDEPIDSTTLADSADGAAHPATASGGVTLGVEGVDSTAMQLSGVDGYAATSGPVVDTSKSFAVSAWARLPKTKPTTASIIATQMGAAQSGFELYYSSSFDRWIFNRYDADTATAAIVRAQSASAPQGGEWAHLVGVYDQVAKTISLYVNGVLAATTAYTTPWNATGALQVGAGSTAATPENFFSGEVDDVRVFDRIVTADEAQVLATQAPVLAARWKLNDSGAAVRATTAHWKMDEAAGASRAEDAMGAFPANKSGTVTFGVSGKIGTAARLNGTTGYLATSAKVVDTTASFSVSGWAKLSAKTNTSVVASQEGTVGSAFALYYSRPDDRWIFNMQSPNSSPVTQVRAISNDPPALNTWTHVAGTYDAGTQQIRLYVNGVLQQTLAQPNTFDADGPVNIGRFKWQGGYASSFLFIGDIDDLRLYGSAISASEVAQLAGAGSTAVVSADDGPIGKHAQLAGNAYIDQGVGLLGNPPGALVLDGSGDYAATTSPVLNTGRSFTVAGWVTTAGRPAANSAIVSQAGTTNSGFILRYAPTAAAGAGGYQIEIPASDTAGATVQTADHANFQSAFEWDHVAVVYDAFADEVRLYVNGELQQTEEANQSFRNNTLSFEATGALQLGRARTGGTFGEYWPGAIDDTWAFNGALNENQIQLLAGDIAAGERATDGFP